MNKYIIITILIVSTVCFAQREMKSIHQQESEFYTKHPELVGRDFIPKGTIRREDLMQPVALSKKVYGFHPYWISDATASNYYYSLLTHVAYFSAEVDNSVSTIGGFSTTRNWSTTQVVNYAKAYGVKIHLCVTMFSNHDRILNNNTKRQNLINNIITQINLRNADGCNIDFESVSSALADSFKTFIYQLGTSLKSLGKELVVELPAVDWNSVYTSTFFSYVNSVVDYYFLMAYDYYWSGSSTAGPVAPLTSGTSIYHVTRSINTYLSRGTGASRLISGFPYYGYDWPVTNSTRMSSTTGSATSRTYTVAKSVIDTLPSANYFSTDASYNVPWYRYTSGAQWRQTWYDDSLSLSKKYDSVKTIGIAGSGMWALGYDGSRTELWAALKRAYSSNSNALHTILADFESSVGVFDQQPTYSGSTTGISTASTANRTVGFAYNGLASLLVVLKDSSSNSNDWTVRLLSGAGSPSNNQTISSTGYIGFYMKTSSASTGAQVALTIDDGAGGTELSSKIDVINDGEWNLYQWNLQGTGWTNFSGGNGNIDGPTVTLDAIMFYAPNNSADWTLYVDDVSFYGSAPLPVQLINLYVLKRSNSLELKWSTATEIQNFGFEIERLKDPKIERSKAWEKIGFVKGAGNSNSPKEYSFIDKTALYGTYSYRLKQIDLDGSYDYSDAVTVTVGSRPQVYDVKNYPNPFNPETNIRFELPNSGNVNLSIYNLLGEKVATLVDEYKEEGIYQEAFDARNLPSGVYFSVLQAGSSIIMKKMLLVK